MNLFLAPLHFYQSQGLRFRYALAESYKFQAIFIIIDISHHSTSHHI